jgi:hypothetical protein
MLRRTGGAMVLATLALWLSACGRVHEPQKSVPPDTKASVAAGEGEAPAEPKRAQITLHVPGMIDRQGIT